jgi:hypothetical protein
MPLDKYTIWNQAVEAVEIYLARNPRELTLIEMETLFSYVNMDLTNSIVEIDPADLEIQRWVGIRLDEVLSQDHRL